LSDLKKRFISSSYVFVLETSTNTRKILIKISQGSVVTQTMLGGLTIHPPNSHSVMCQKLRKLVEGRQSYCNESCPCVFWPTR